MKSLTLSDEEVTRLSYSVLDSEIRRLSTKSVHEILRVKDGPIQLILYKTGKIVHNGTPETKQFLTNFLEVEKEFDFIVGSDEAGKGEWFGPFIAAAVGLSPQEILNLRLSGAQDSKNMSLSSMKDIQEIILRKRIPMKIWYFRPETYNQRYVKFQEEGQTLNDMLAWTHTKAIEDVLSRGNFTNAQVVIDKFDLDATEFRLGKVRRFKVSIIQKSKGESEIPVAVASILAKLRFEEEVDKLDHKYGLNLRDCKPTDVPSEILPLVAKLHFKNVQQATFQT